MKKFSLRMTLGIILLASVALKADPEISEHENPLFVYITEENDTVNSLADRFETTPGRIRSWNRDYHGMAGEKLRLPNRSPLKVKNMDSPVSPEDFTSSSGFPSDAVKRFNFHSLKDKNTLSSYAIPERYSPWILYRPFFSNGMGNLTYLAWPLVIAVMLLTAVIALGVLKFFYFLLKFLKTRQTTDTAPLTQPKSPSLMVEITSGSRKGEKFSFQKSDVVIGRSLENDLSFPDESIVSGSHVHFFAKTDGWFLKDMESSNGTLIGRRKVFEQRVAISEEVELGFGGPKIRVTPFVPQQAAALGMKGTTYIASVVSQSIKRRTSVYAYGFAAVALAIIGLILGNVILSRKISLVAQNVRSHQLQIEKIRTDMDRMDENIAALKTRQSDLEQNLRGLEGRYDEIAKQVAGNTGDIARIKEILQKLPEALKNGGEAIEEFSRAVRSLNNAVLEPNASEDDVAKRVQEVEVQYDRVAHYVNVVNIADDYFNRPESSSSGSSDVALLQETVNQSRSNLETVVRPAMETLNSLVSNNIVRPGSDLQREVQGTGPLSSLL